MFERFTQEARQVVVFAQEEARALGHDHIGTEHILLGLVDEHEGIAARILFDLDVHPDTIRDGVIRASAGAPGESFGSRLGAGEPAPNPFPYQPPAAPPDLELGWRSRPIALATLGAGVLTRRAFDRSKTGQLEPLAMQLLARLTLGLPDTALTELGEPLESLAIDLACDQHELYGAVGILADRGLASYREDVDDGDGGQRISITTEGFIAVQAWLEQVARLLGTWPPDQPNVDDATG